MEDKEFRNKLKEFGDLDEPETDLDLQFVKLNPIITDCELGCGVIVKGQVIQKQMMFYPEPHWRIKCVNCQQCIHPSGKGFCKQNTFQAEIKKIFNNKDK